MSYTFLECNYFISISKLKTHEFERFTGILKNQFGCISTKNKEQYHPYLSEVIGDINSVLKPDLCVIDGLIAMEGRGPGFGDPKEMNLLIMGDDPVATDAVASTIIGINPYDVPHLKATAKRGLGEIELKNICISGERVEDVESNFNFIPPLAFLFFRLSLRIHRLAHFFGALVTFFSFFGRQLERLARALYTRSLMEVLIRVARGGLRIPRPIHKLLLILYLSLRYFKK